MRVSRSRISCRASAFSPVVAAFSRRGCSQMRKSRCVITSPTIQQTPRGDQGQAATAAACVGQQTGHRDCRGTRATRVDPAVCGAAARVPGRGIGRALADRRERHLTHRPGRPASGPRWRKPVILVVDDDAEVRSSIAAVLAVEGFVVVEAETGREAVDESRAAEPDLVVMDLSLPALDGAAAMRVMKGFLPTRHIPVIAITGMSMSPESLLALGFDAALRKPCSAENLLGAITSLLQAPQRRAQRP
ncbi:MAG TPA: response regulator [Polyangiaceae bacterium]